MGVGGWRCWRRTTAAWPAGLSGPDSGLAGPGVAWFALLLRPNGDHDGAEGTSLLHDGGGGGPSRAAMALLLPSTNASSPRSFGPVVVVSVRRRGWRCDRGGACWWAASWLVGSDPVGRWGLELGEILAGSSGSDTVTPAGATIPPWRVSVVFIPLYPPCAGGNHRIRPGSSVVGVVSFLEVLLGSRRIGT